VQLPAAAERQALVGRIPDQRVLEAQAAILIGLNERAQPIPQARGRRPPIPATAAARSASLSAGASRSTCAPTTSSMDSGSSTASSARLATRTSSRANSGLPVDRSAIAAS
jgi:hypothetical protein